jgi:7,8-dihydroneopterin aldolase/epimerase/oxygenase
MDRISLRNMKFFGYHGCYASEKETGQLFEVDVDLFADLSNAAVSDDLRQTVDYVDMFRRIRSVMEEEKHNLLERVATRIAEVSLASEKVRNVTVRVRKPGVALGGVLDTVEVEVSRSKKV